ncbi:MAG: enoyl-CoA hydratase/isomerase family protein [Arachnia sp.]
MTELLTDVVGGVGQLTLNRPRAINALTLEMMRAATTTLELWAGDQAVNAVEIRGAGDRGLCSGADVRAMAAQVTAGDQWLAFLAAEYSLDQVIAHYPKPVTAYMRGVCMGGGIGISAHASRRIVDETTVCAMPETKIGWCPDVGTMGLLARGGAVGRHVALTSATFAGGDAIRLGFADEPANGPLNAALSESAWITECYAPDDAIEIAHRLETSPSPEARVAARELRARSPLGVLVAMRLLLRSADLSLSEVFEQDLRVAQRLLPLGDFAEGVRALLIDKDNTPEWRYARLEDVPPSLIDDLVG